MPGAAGDNDSRFGDGLAAAARSIIADARTALTDPTLPEPDAVHDLRKAFKRWRALLRLLARPLGAPANQCARKARELMRLLGRRARCAGGARCARRSAQVRRCRSRPPPLETIRARLTTLRDEAEAASFTTEVREELTRYLDFATLSSSAGRCHDRFRRRRRRDHRHLSAGAPLCPNWPETDAEHLHELRRRVVEHRHQMDLVEPLWLRFAKLGRKKRTPARPARRLPGSGGACEFTTPHRLLAPWRSRLTPLIEDRRATHLKNAARLAGRLFAEKPKAFRQRIAALWTARRAPQEPRGDERVTFVMQFVAARD